MEPKRKEGFRETILFALIALAIVIPVRIFVAQPFIVHGSSMEPTFWSGEYLIIDQLTYRFHAPQRGDVIVMRYPRDTSTFFIKRIIGLPNETVEFAGKNVIIHPVNGGTPFTLDQSFLDPTRVGNEYGMYALGDDEYFVMGDNRIVSDDSRTWGALPRQDVVGKAFLRLFPFSRVSDLPGHVSLPQ